MSRPYCDLGFLLLLVVKAPGSTLAWRLLQTQTLPVPVSTWQVLQVENGLRIQAAGADPAAAAAAAAGLEQWEFLLRELVFVLEPSPWEAACELARSWNRLAPPPPPASTFLLHPALAAVQCATVFLSVDPRSRPWARKAGLKLLPATL